MTNMRFDDDVVIVTGAGRGLGREHALAFARRGAAVVINDVMDGSGGPSTAHEVAAEITAAGGRAVPVCASVAGTGGAAGIVETALHTFGKVTVLVNNAGVIDFTPLAQMSEAAWHRMTSITLDGTYNMTHAVWPLFLDQGYGRVINTTSNAGFAGNETLVHYGAAKMGVAGFTRALAQEAVGTGITVNAIAPMAVTRMNRDAFFDGADVQGGDWQADIRSGKVPMGPPEMVSPTVLWLAHRSTTVNGEIFSTSSGKVARVAFVIGGGYFDPDHTPEDLRAHASQIRSIAEVFEPTCTADELMLIPPLFKAL